MAIHAQKKGKRGENEFCKWLDENVYNNSIASRNYNQSDGHSSDIITKDFLFEVKRQEVLGLDDWWHQVVVASKRLPGQLIPVVAFRQNKKKWEFLIPASVIGIELGNIRLTEKIFVQFARKIVNFSSEFTTEEQDLFNELTPLEIDEIKRKFNVLGYSKEYLADKYNISVKIVSFIVGSK